MGAQPGAVGVPSGIECAGVSNCAGETDLTEMEDTVNERDVQVLHDDDNASGDAGSEVLGKAATAAFRLGSLVEYAMIGHIFTNPADPRINSHVTGGIG